MWRYLVVALIVCVSVFAQQGVKGVASDNGASATTNRVATLPCISESNTPSASTAGYDAACRVDLHGNLLVTLFPNTSFATFAASKNVAPASSATDIAVLPGNATNTVIVTQIMMSCTQTTAGIQTVQLIKRSSADSGGTSSSMTAVPLDSNDSAAVSAPLVYTANPTTGTAVGNIDTELIGMMAPATATPNDIYFWRPAMGQSVVLRGTAQQLALNLNSTTISGASCDVNFQWIETTGL